MSVKVNPKIIEYYNNETKKANIKDIVMMNRRELNTKADVDQYIKMMKLLEKSFKDLF